MKKYNHDEIIIYNKNEIPKNLENIKKDILNSPIDLIFISNDMRIIVGVLTNDYLRTRNVVNISDFGYINKSKLSIYLILHSLQDSKKHLIPVLNSDSTLFQVYTDEPDLDIYTNYFKFIVNFLDLSKNMIFFTNKICLIKPSNNNKLLLFELFLEIIDRYNFNYKILDEKLLLKDVDITYLYIATDAMTLRKYKFINNKLRLISYENFLLFYEGSFVWEIRHQLSKLKILCFHGSGSTSGTNNYTKEIYKSIKNHCRVAAENGEQCSARNVPSIIENDFFKNINSNGYKHDIENMPFSMINKYGINKLEDVSSKYLNVNNGFRKTFYQCNNPIQNIYLFGSCFFIGPLVEDKYTIASLLQKKLIDNGYNINVINCGVWGNLYERMTDIEFCANDIIIVEARIPGRPYLDWDTVADKYLVTAEECTNHITHCNHTANKKFADGLYDFISSYLANNSQSKTKCLPTIKFDWGIAIKKHYLDYFFSNINLKKYNKIGSIVMNCNPFTLGHEFLIKSALKIVDLSLFNFFDRLLMIYNAVKKYNNIYIVPSGRFILSNRTFPEYFIKIEDSNLVDNVLFDIEIFAKFIAKPLDIKYRFVGEECNDKVTLEYNNAMKIILPKYNIKLIEFKRHAKNNRIISASLIRDAMKNNNKSIIQNYLPDSTLKYFKIET